MNTSLSLRGERLLINGREIYADLPGSNPDVHGLMFNARFIQGIFDDASDPGRFARWGFGSWNADDQTDRLIAALPQWYSYGLRGFTVGLQGGGPCFTIPNHTIDNNPFGEDGCTFDAAYAGRLYRLLSAADRMGMICIVSYLYGSQSLRLSDGRAIRNAVITASRLLKEWGFENVIIEVANEQNIGGFAEKHRIVAEPQGMSLLIDIARRESGGMPVGCSGSGGAISREIARASDVVLIHGNGQSRQRYYNLVERAREYASGKPVICNEDSQAVGQLAVAARTRTSWGYYNNLSKQEPPTRWEILPGEDTFFALRMAELIGIDMPRIPPADRYYLHGFEPEMVWEGRRWIRLASLYPESVDFVDYYKNGTLYYSSFDEPYSVHFEANWNQRGVETRDGDEWLAMVHVSDGDELEIRQTVES